MAGEDLGNEPEDDVKRIRLSARANEKLLLEHKRICHLCGGEIQNGQRWERSHLIDLAAGGDDVPENWAPAHHRCHRDYTSTVSAPRIAKTRRQRQKHLGAKPLASRPIPTRANPWGSR